MERKFEFENNASRKELKVKLKGMFNQEDAVAYINEYKDIIKRINPNETVFNIDCTQMTVTPADVVPQLQGCFEMYRDDNFKKINFVLSKEKGVILKTQFGRLARMVNLTNIDIAI